MRIYTPMKPRLPLVAAILAAMCFVAGVPNTANAQAQLVWGNNGCLYQHSGHRMVPIECHVYEGTLGTTVARNAQGIFVLSNGRWLTKNAFMQETLMALQSLIAVLQQAHDSQGGVSVHPDGSLSITPAPLNFNPRSQADPCIASYNQLSMQAKVACQNYWGFVNRMARIQVQPSVYLYRYY